MVSYLKHPIEFAKKIVKETDEKVRRVYWTNNEIDKWFGKRLVREIINNKTTCFMNPCSDLNLVSSYILSQKNIPHNWVIEKHPPTKMFNFIRLHFVLELESQGKSYVINYKGLNEVYIYEGKYSGHKTINSSKIIRFPSQQINLEKSLYENLSNSNLGSLLKDFSLEKNINRLKQDNSLENYEKFKKKYGEKFIIK